MDPLGDKIKALEAKFEGERLNPERPFIIRLDGHGFSKFTKGFEKPLDMCFVYAMQKTAEDLLDEFNARTAFVESDEITLVFPPTSNPDSTLIYSGRRQKLCSLTAGKASASFNHHLRVVYTEKYIEPTRRAKLGRAYFDARVFSVANEKEAYEAVWWRYHMDTFRNGVSGLAQRHFSHKLLHKKPLGEVIKMLEEEHILLADQNPHLLYGSFVKKELYETTGFDPKQNKDVDVMRSCYVAFSLPKWKEETEEERIDLVMRKYK